MSAQRPMRNLVLACLGACLAATPIAAMAHGTSSQLSVQNRFDGEAEVWLNGRLAGMVRGDSTATFSVAPGCVKVVVQRPTSDYVLANTTLTLAPHTSTTLPVAAPKGVVRVTNGGEVALRVRADNASNWVQPGATVQLTVEMGQVEMTASAMDPRGAEWVVMERNMWAEPGQPGYTTLRPEPTTLVLDNNYRMRLQALVDGVSIGWVEPGRELRTWLRPGPAQVVMLDYAGRVREQSSVVVRKGDDTWVSANPPVHQQPPVVVYRPGPPARPGVVVNTTWSPDRPGHDHDGHGHHDHDHGDHGHDHDRDDDRDDHPSGCSCGGH